MREAQWSRTANALLLFIEANPDELLTTLAKIVAETAARCFTDIAVDPETGRTMPWRSPGTHSKPPTWTPQRSSRVDFVLNSVKLLLIEVEETFRPSRNRVFNLLAGPDVTSR